MPNTRTTISIPQSLLERVAALAEGRQIPRSHVFVLAVEEYLRQVEDQELLQAINAAYEEPPSPDKEIHREGMRRRHKQQTCGSFGL